MFKSLDIYKVRYLVGQRTILDKVYYFRYTPNWLMKLMAEWELKKLSKLIGKTLDKQTEN